MRRHLCLLTLSTCLACAGGQPEGSTVTPEAEDATSDAGFGPWQAPLHADHPLVGTAWSVAEGAPLTRAELEERVAAARFVLLGETHDHPDHHRLQGAMIQAALDAGREPAVAYEMLEPGDQAAIDEFVAAGTAEADAFAELVDWANSGWPEWSLYRPAFAPALAAKLPILAAQVPRSETKRFMSEGLGIVEDETVARYGLDQPLAEDMQAGLLDEMFASHCEMVPREHLAPMIEIQRIRDARMADALLRGAEAKGRAILVAGTGHTRAIGVPRLLRQTGVDEAEILSVGFVAVDPERGEASEYGEEFDVIVLTPGVEREDPCAQMRAKAGEAAGAESAQE